MGFYRNDLVTLQPDVHVFTGAVDGVDDRNVTNGEAGDGVGPGGRWHSVLRGLCATPKYSEADGCGIEK